MLEKAIEYTKSRHEDTEYIFVNEKDISRQQQYTTIKNKILQMIRDKKLLDNDRKTFGFNSRMFWHYYGVKLMELPLDDWTVAKLLGHKRLGNVKYYRKMSNQILADETRKARDEMSRIILKNLEGWGMNMNKYDNMFAVNKERSREKITRAKIAIRELMEDGEWVSVPKLIKLTGLPQKRLYKKEQVLKE